MRDVHTHCPCNGVWLCRTCHSWAHAHPFDARAGGFIVSRSIAEPAQDKVETFFGPIILACTGGFTHFSHRVNGET